MKQRILFLLPMFLILFAACSMDEILGNQSITTFPATQAPSFPKSQATAEVEAQIAIQTEVSFFPPGTYTSVPITNKSVVNSTVEAATQSVILTEASFFSPATQEPTLGAISCPGALEIHLKKYQEARVAFTDGLPMRIRSKPGFSKDILVRVPEGTRLTILSDAECTDNSAWFYIRTEDGQEGWMAESQNDVYLLDPLP